MSRVFIEADSLTTDELRAALAALSRLHHSEPAEMPPDLSTIDGKGRAFVGLNGPERWTVRTPALYPDHAIGIVEAIARATRVGDLDEPLSTSEVRALEQDAENGATP